MDWLYLIVMGYIIASALRGYHRGFIRVAYSVVRLLAATVLISLFVPMAKQALIEHSPLPQMIEDSCEAYARKNIQKKLKDGSLLEDFSLPGVTLPASLQRELKHGTQKSIAKALESSGIYRKMGRVAADYCIGTAAFFLCSVSVSLLLAVIGKNLNLFSKLPGIRLIDMVFGFLAGAGKAFLVIWIVFLLIRVTAVFPASAALIKMIKENPVLDSLYEKNWILRLMQSLSFIK